MAKEVGRVHTEMWLYRTAPDPSLPDSTTLFCLLFGRDARTQIDAVFPGLDETGLVGIGLNTYTSNQARMARPEMQRERNRMSIVKPNA